MDMLRASLPKNRRDLERGRELSARSRFMAKYQRLAFSVAAVLTVLLCLCAYMMHSPNVADSTPTERVLRVHTPGAERAAADDVRSARDILTAGGKVYHTQDELPRGFDEPCRRLSDFELSNDAVLEGYKISDILMTMCRIIHDRVGCMGEGALPAKLIDVVPPLNLCITAYKPSNGTCVHFVNPVVHVPAPPSNGYARIKFHHHFPYIGSVNVTREPRIHITYNDHARAYERTTQEFGTNHSLYIQDADAIMAGTFPPKLVSAQ